MHHFVQSSNERLRKLGYRLTPQRYMILSVIQEAQEHLTVEQITERVQQRNPFVSLSTVYRTLELLKKLDLVRESRLSGEQPHYEVAGDQAHHHLVCRRCHATLHLDEQLLGNLHEELQEKYHFYGLSLSLVASGYCTACWEEVEREEQQLEGVSEAPEAQSQQGQCQQVKGQQGVEQVDVEKEIQGDKAVEEHTTGTYDPTRRDL
ncbi:MAG: transcriptional repressor [Ktedonobacteraceae bacterium]|nr:transcriptional repressor [Ktedonobacteraceae bacterium]